MESGFRSKVYATIAGTGLWSRVVYREHFGEAAGRKSCVKQFIARSHINVKFIKIQKKADCRLPTADCIF